jgi:hypothetical protein
VVGYKKGGKLSIIGKLFIDGEYRHAGWLVKNIPGDT